MKVGVIKLGARISFNANDTSGGNGEARSIIKMLRGGGCEVHIFTKILKKDNLLQEYTWHNLGDGLPALDGLDALMVLNGNVNFFGGAEDVEQLLNYNVINSFKGPVFYLLCDPELTLKQVWPAVEKKPWAANWKREELEITRKDLIFLTQPGNVQKVLNDLGDREVKPGRAYHFPFEKFPCLNPRLPFNSTPEVDLSYGGTMRGGKRVEKMVKFYWGHDEDVKVEMFGKIELGDFEKIAEKKKQLLHGQGRPPIFTGPVKYDEMLPKMNKAMAHCVIGDPYYEKIDDIAQRTYESIWSSVVTFIDSDADTQRRVYGSSPELSEFLYVSSRKELIDRIRELKCDPALRSLIVAHQFEVVNFDDTVYCRTFTKLVEDIIASRK